MTDSISAVSVRQLPVHLSAAIGRRFLGDLKKCMQTDRPRVVLDCSRLHLIDRRAAHMLLCCLEEAMKRNGDVRLSGIPADGMAMLELTGVVRLFEMFDTAADAVNSFARHALPAAPQGG